MEFVSYEELKSFLDKNSFSILAGAIDSDIIPFDSGFIYRQNNIRLYSLDTVGIKDPSVIRMFRVDDYIIFVEIRIPEKIYLYDEGKLKRISITAEGNRKRFRIYGHKYSYNALGVCRDED